MANMRVKATVPIHWYKGQSVNDVCIFSMHAIRIGERIARQIKLLPPNNQVVVIRGAFCILIQHSTSLELLLNMVHTWSVSWIQVYVFTLHDVNPIHAHWIRSLRIHASWWVQWVHQKYACTGHKSTVRKDRVHWWVSYFMRNCWGLRGDFRDCQVQTRT